MTPHDDNIPASSGQRGRGRVRLVLASRNPDKIEELSAMLADLAIEVVSVRDIAGVAEVVEDGATIEENAVKKAETIASETGLPALADDTGLEIGGLGGRPGVMSARYAGPSASYEDNNAKLLRELSGRHPRERRAAFRCVVALCLPGLGARTVEGRTQGRIVESPRGTGGFGYDSVFMPDGSRKTYAEMLPSEKNAVSHRGKAMRAARDLIAELLTT